MKSLFMKYMESQCAEGVLRPFHTDRDVVKQSESLPNSAYTPIDHLQLIHACTIPADRECILRLYTR